jgi:uncharacterized protein
MNDAAAPDPREIVTRLFSGIDRDDRAAAMEAIREGYEIFNIAGAKGWLPAFADDIEWTQGSDAPEPQVFHGHDGVIRQQEIAMEVWDSFRIVPADYRFAGDALVVTVDVSAKGHASGMEIDARMAHLWRQRDGLITRFEIFLDAEKALEAVDSS